jgi:hypothetical protein
LTHSVKKWAKMLWFFPGVRPFSPLVACALSRASPFIGHPGRDQHSRPQRVTRRRLCWMAGCPCGQSPPGTSCSLAAPRCRLAHPMSRAGRPHHRWSSRLSLGLLALAARDGCRRPARALHPRTRTPRLRKRVPTAVSQVVRKDRQMQIVHLVGTRRSKPSKVVRKDCRIAVSTPQRNTMSPRHSAMAAPDDPSTIALEVVRKGRRLNKTPPLMLCTPIPHVLSLDPMSRGRLQHIRQLSISGDRLPLLGGRLPACPRSPVVSCQSSILRPSPKAKTSTEPG